MGIVSRSDLARAVGPDAPVLDVATREVVTVFADQSLDLALLRLCRRGVRQAPVVLRTTPNQVVGILSLGDISAALTETP